MARRKKAKSNSHIADAVHQLRAARQRALILTRLLAILEERFSWRNGEPPPVSLSIDGARVRPDRDVVEQLRGELLVGATLASQQAQAILAAGIDIDVPRLPGLVDN